MVTVTINKFPLPIQDIKTKTELDFSSKGLQVEDAIIIAALIPLNVSRYRIVLFLSKVLYSVAKGALTSLNMSKNYLGGYYDDEGDWISDMSGIKALAAAILESK